MPVGVVRCFHNQDGRHTNLMALFVGTCAVQVDWADSVLSHAADTGLSLNAEGNLVEGA